jgi:hypothetical protein
MTLGGDIVCGTTTLQNVAPFQPLAALMEKIHRDWTFRIRDTNDTGTLNSASSLFVQNHTHCQQKILK